MFQGRILINQIVLLSPFAKVPVLNDLKPNPEDTIGQVGIKADGLCLVKIQLTVILDGYI